MSPALLLILGGSPVFASPHFATFSQEKRKTRQVAFRSEISYNGVYAKIM